MPLFIACYANEGFRESIYKHNRFCVKAKLKWGTKLMPILAESLKSAALISKIVEKKYLVRFTNIKVLVPL